MKITKKLVILTLVSVLLLTLFSSAMASEKLDNYTAALQSGTWTMKSATLVDTSKAAPNLTLVGAYYTSISLPNSEITLFEGASGEIYIGFSHKNLYGGKFDDFAIAEIIFSEDMNSFILYSDNCADLYTK